MTNIDVPRVLQGMVVEEVNGEVVANKSYNEVGVRVALNRISDLCTTYLVLCTKCYKVRH